MTKTFRVAEHIFRLSIPDGHPVIARLDNYSPFEVISDEYLFDLEIVSELEEGPSESVLVSEDPSDPDMSRLDLRRCKEGWCITMQPRLNAAIVGKCVCSSDFRHGKLLFMTKRTSDAVYAVNNALMLLFAFNTAVFGTLEMHSSVVVKDGTAYMFLGKSGAGKSTHSRMWLENIEGAWLLNDDNPVIRVDAEGTVKIYGTPWSGKTPCYKNAEAPVGGFALINKSPENKIHQLMLPEAYSIIYSSCSGFKADSKMADGLFKTISQVVMNVPGYILDCLPDGDAARLCYSTAKESTNS